MEKRNMKKLIFSTCSVFLVIAMFTTLALADVADVIVYNISIEPYVISLNANSDSEANPETIVRIGCYLNGKKIIGSNVYFMIGNALVATSDDMRVTRTGIGQVYFDKATIQKHALANSLEGFIAVTVSGSYTYEPILDGDSTEPIEFVGAGVVFFR